MGGKGEGEVTRAEVGARAAGGQERREWQLRPHDVEGLGHPLGAEPAARPDDRRAAVGPDDQVGAKLGWAGGCVDLHADRQGP